METLRVSPNLTVFSRAWSSHHNAKTDASTAPKPEGVNLCIGSKCRLLPWTDIPQISIWGEVPDHRHRTRSTGLVKTATQAIRKRLAWQTRPYEQRRMWTATQRTQPTLIRGEHAESDSIGTRYEVQDSYEAF